MATESPLQIFQDCVQSQDHGILTITQGKQKRLFCLKAGFLIFVASNVLEDQLTQLLVEEGQLDQTAVDALLKEAKEKKVQATQLLKNSEDISNQMLQAAMGRWIVRLLVESLHWENGKASFSRGTPNLQNEITTHVDPLDVFLAYADHEKASDSDIKRQLGSTQRRVQWTPLAHDRSGNRPLSKREQAILSQADGNHTLQECLDATDHKQAHHAAFALLSAGWLEIEQPTEKAASSQSSETFSIPTEKDEIDTWLKEVNTESHYSVLDLPNNASADDIRKRYYAIARRLHPDRFRAEGTDEAFIQRIEKYFAHVTEAYNTLENPDSRDEYNRELADRSQSSEPSINVEKEQQVVAKKNYLHGMSLVERRRLHEAVGFLKNAAQMAPDEPDYLFAYAELLMRNPRERAEAEKCFLEVIRLTPSDPRPYLNLGKLYARSGHKPQAVSLFEEALRWDSSSAEAKAQLAELDESNVKPFSLDNYRPVYSS